MFEPERIAPGGWVRFGRGRRSSIVVLAALIIVCGLSTKLHHGASRDEARPLRAVLSSRVPGERAIALSTASLYAPNDPWKRYLAGEDVCAGGERTDLPLARQLSIVVCLVDYARKRHGLRALRPMTALNAGAARKAAAIARCDRFAHNPCGGDWTSAVRSTGYPYSFGENLYIASGPWAAPRVAVDAWLNSAEHRHNLFDPAWGEQGFAIMKFERAGVEPESVVWVNVLGSG